MTPYHVRMAGAQAKRALRRGDLAEAERWFKLCERACAIAERLDQRVATEEARQARINLPAYLRP